MKRVRTELIKFGKKVTTVSLKVKILIDSYCLFVNQANLRLKRT